MDATPKGGESSGDSNRSVEGVNSLEGLVRCPQGTKVLDSTESHVKLGGYSEFINIEIRSCMKINGKMDR